ncbi:outer membrane protein assembly factor BamE [Tateyamaria sp. SN6-1]|uniref:outer membrane protein assembly factor BamE n=1 Tax=Tateyamaria sp. SN6-1 TaxID=3092148 RepID=UPI0039F60A49
MRTWTLISFLAATVSLAACSAQFRNHGYIPPEEDLQELAVGIDTRASVEDLVGTPTSGGVLEGGDFYYVAHTTRTFGPRRPEVVDRQVLAMSFDDEGVLQNIERFGLEEGRVVVLERRVTDSGVTDTPFLRQLLGSFGRILPGQGAFGS